MSVINILFLLQLAKRRLLRPQYPDDAVAHRQLKRQILESLRYTIRIINQVHVKDTIELDKGSNVLSKVMSIGQNHMTKLKEER